MEGDLSVLLQSEQGFLESPPEGEPRFIRELPKSRSLRELLDASPRPTLLARLAPLLSLSRLLSFLHEQGAVHRDLRPDRAFLGDGGAFYLGGFRFTRLLGEREGASPSRPLPLPLG